MPVKPLVSIKSLTVRINDRILFENLSVSVHRRELLVVAGANGSGKSTLLGLMDSAISDSREEFTKPGFEINGSIFTLPGIRSTYLRQDRWIISSSTYNENQRTAKHVGEIAVLRDEFGVSQSLSESAKMSDGEARKLSIIHALLDDADLYLLDEPTNHLDIAGITALERHIEQLKRENRGIILITHDRTLADNFADQTVLFTENGVYRSAGGITAIGTLKQSDIDSRQRRADEIRKKVNQLQEDARAKAGWSAVSERRKRGAGLSRPYFARKSARMAKRAKITQMRIEKELSQLKKTKPYIPKELNIHLPEYDVRHRTVLHLEDVAFKYDTQRDSKQTTEPILNDITISASTRDRICIMGANGSGKSTLIKLIRGELIPASGIRHFNESVSSAIIPQGLKGFFKRDTLLENFNDCDRSQTEIRQYLGAALIRKDKVLEPLDSFSHGELMRAAIVKCVLLRAEFLYLDEPTTHLDIESIEILEEILNGFPGGFLLISHDRAFVSNVTEKLYTIEDNRLRLI